MSTTTAIQIDDFIHRIQKILKKNTTLFPTNEKNLVTDVLDHKDALIQSSTRGVIPYIVVMEGTQMMREMEVAGRDTRDVEGGRVYELELWIISIVQEIDAVASQKKLDIITQVIRDALGRNMRLIDPDSSDDPLCRTHTRFQIPHLVSLDNATLRAENVVVRPQVYVSLRSN